MQPTGIKGSNRLYGKPKDWDPNSGECVPLYARGDDEAGTVASAWTPSPEELAQLNAGGNVVLTVFGDQPPVMLSVETPDA